MCETEASRVWAETGTQLRKSDVRRPFAMAAEAGAMQARAGHDEESPRGNRIAGTAVRADAGRDAAPTHSGARLASEDGTHASVAGGSALTGGEARHRGVAPPRRATTPERTTAGGAAKVGSSGRDSTLAPGSTGLPRAPAVVRWIWRVEAVCAFFTGHDPRADGRADGGRASNLKGETLSWRQWLRRAFALLCALFNALRLQRAVYWTLTSLQDTTWHQTLAVDLVALSTDAVLLLAGVLWVTATCSSRARAPESTLDELGGVSRLLARIQRRPLTVPELMGRLPGPLSHRSLVRLGSGARRDALLATLGTVILAAGQVNSWLAPDTSDDFRDLMRYNTFWESADMRWTMVLSTAIGLISTTVTLASTLQAAVVARVLAAHVRDFGRRVTVVAVTVDVEAGGHEDGTGGQGRSSGSVGPEPSVADVPRGDRGPDLREFRDVFESHVTSVVHGVNHDIWLTGHTCLGTTGVIVVVCMVTFLRGQDMASGVRFMVFSIAVLCLTVFIALALTFASVNFGVVKLQSDMARMSVFRVSVGSTIAPAPSGRVFDDVARERARALAAADVLLQTSTRFVGIRAVGPTVMTFTLVQRLIGALTSLFVLLLSV